MQYSFLNLQSSTQVKMPNPSRWCFTLNNPTEEEKVALSELDVKCIGYGEEVAASGTPHLQGFLYWNEPRGLKKTRLLLGGRAHVEAMKGTFKQNVDYCSKDGKYTFRGEEPKTKAEAAHDSHKTYRHVIQLAERSEIDQIKDLYPGMYVRYRRTIEAISDEATGVTSDLQVIENEWHFGPSGTGKSRGLRVSYPDAYRKNANKWWCGYRGQSDVILEDLDGTHACLGHHIKLWADHYPFLGEVKGGGKIIRPQRLFVTSNYHPREIWTDKNMLDPILRRFKLVYYGEDHHLYKSD